MDSSSNKLHVLSNFLIIILDSFDRIFWLLRSNKSAACAGHCMLKKLGFVEYENNVLILINRNY